MALSIPSRVELLTALQSQILPRVEDGTAPLVLASPPVSTPGIRTFPQEAPLLRSPQRGRSKETVIRWVEEGFNAVRYPVFIWVASGEADMRIGVTTRMAAQNKSLSKKYGVYVASLPAGTFFLIPPGVPFSDASRPHWERTSVLEIHSQLLWLHLVPAGASLHTCTTNGARHSSTRSIFLNETRLLQLSEAVIEELQQREIGGEAMARHYLALLLLYLERHVRDLRMPLEDAIATPSGKPQEGSESTPVQRACRYIDTHLGHKLTLELIAGYSYVSPTHLNRLFRAEMNLSVGEYLTQRRLEQACSLLENTDLPIQRVGAFSGFARSEHFNRTFRRHFSMSPGDYRRSFRA